MDGSDKLNLDQHTDDHSATPTASSAPHHDATSSQPTPVDGRVENGNHARAAVTAALRSSPTPAALVSKGAGTTGVPPSERPVVGKISPAKCLRNPRHEAFALEIVKGTKAFDAYVLVGYSVPRPKNSDKISADRASQVARVEAQKLLRLPTVAARIAYLQQRAADATIITRSWLLHEAQGTYFAAREAGQYTAALKALEMLGRDHGTFIPKQENGKPGDFSQMTDKELDEQIARRERELSQRPAREAVSAGSGLSRNQLN